MSDTACISCRSPKTTQTCGVCEERVCAKCAEFLAKDSFPFLTKPAAELLHTHYCPQCFGNHIEPARESYDAMMEQAKTVFVFFTTQKHRIPVLSKGKEQIRVDANADRDETILRMAFQAAELGCNAIVDTEVVSQKLRNEGYQTTAWKGVCFPAQVDAEKIEKSFW